MAGFDDCDDCGFDRRGIIVIEKPQAPIRNLAWAAGILEGEGSFTFQKPYRGRAAYPVVFLQMCDEDVVKDVRAIFNNMGWLGQVRRTTRWKPIWMWRARYGEAETIMNLVLPYMGKRRSGRIRQLLAKDYRKAEWKAE